MVTKTLLVLVVLGASTTVAYAQPSKLRIGIYAPSVEFGTAQARLAYVQGLAKAIEQSTGIKTEAQSYASVSALKSDNVDFAIIDGPCYAVNLSGRLLANANIGGGVARTWALYSAAGDTMQALRGKKLAFVATGCNDAGFIDNAMLESEVDAQFFGARLGEKDLTGAIADVQSYKTAHAVFAPVGAVKGLTKLFETGSVPNPGFVQLDTKLPQATADKVATAVIGFGGAGAISGWTKPSREPFTQLSSRLGHVTKQAVLATPEPVRIDAREVLIDPTTLRDTAFVAVRHHYVRPSGARM
ncbi:MAG: hypothetical protein ABI591_12625 [Kofleriaceae bacterium]